MKEISSHTPMHNPKINSNFIFYIRNSKVALWRRETQSGTFLEPHINVDNHSWVCKTDLELITSEEVFATGIANTQNGMTHIRNSTDQRDPFDVFRSTRWDC